MSILQIEISDETRAQIEAHAKSEGHDAASWLLRLAEKELRQDEPEESEEQRQYIRSELLKALGSGPGVVADAAWWKELEEEVMADLESHAK